MTSGDGAARLAGMSAALSFALGVLARLALVAVMLSTVCLLRPVLLFTIAAVLVIVLRLLVQMNRVARSAEA